MLKSIIVSSFAISTTLAAEAAHFVYPEDTITDSWAAATVLPAGGTNYCGNTHIYQSPIDIQTSTLSTCPTSKALNWQLTNTIHKFEVENTGHNLKMVPVCCGIVDNSDSGEGDSNDHDDSNDNPEFENLENGDAFGTLTDIFGTMETYCLDSFHIHWGIDDNTGSEHRINGEQSVMEMHFVHRACKYASISRATEDEIADDSTAESTLAVVSVMFEIGAANLLIQKIVDQVTDLQVAKQKIEIEASDLDMFDVVPMNDGKVIGDYYHYKGSLTTPPCNPVVSWHVLGTKMTVTAAQLQALRENIHNGEEPASNSAPNFRGAKLNKHTVSKCSAAGSGDDDSDEQDD